MGQYYTPILKEQETNKWKWGLCYDFHNGAKLMEHSYVGNNFVGAIANYIKDNPCKVWWVGDYSNSEDDNGRTTPKVVWNYWNKSQYKEQDKITKGYVSMRTGFLINHTKRMFINMKTYCKKVIDYRVSNQKGDKEHPEWCINNPLSLLTTIGNGLGGGDFHSGVGKELIGDWAGCVLEYTEHDEPEIEGYTEFTDIFNEEY